MIIQDVDDLKLVLSVLVWKLGLDGVTVTAAEVVRFEQEQRQFGLRLSASCSDEDTMVFKIITGEHP